MNLVHFKFAVSSMQKHIFSIIGFVLVFIGFLVPVFYWSFLPKEICVICRAEVDLEKASKIGDFIGGVVGPIWTLASVFFFIETIKLQREAIAPTESIAKNTKILDSIANQFNHHRELLLKLHLNSEQFNKLKVLSSGRYKLLEPPLYAEHAFRFTYDILKELSKSINENNTDHAYVLALKNRLDLLLDWLYSMEFNLFFRSNYQSIGIILAEVKLAYSPNDKQIGYIHKIVENRFEFHMFDSFCDLINEFCDNYENIYPQNQNEDIDPYIDKCLTLVAWSTAFKYNYGSYLQIVREAS